MFTRKPWRIGSLTILATAAVSLLAAEAAWAQGSGHGGSGRDKIPPDPVSDLAGAATHNSITLTWTATGDDGDSGTALLYDLRYRTDQPITETNWDSAWQVRGEPSPQPGGSSEAFTVNGLLPETTYYLALNVADDWGNWSGLSNVVSEVTLTPPPGAWWIEAVDSTVYVLWENWLVYDPSGNPAIAYRIDRHDLVEEVRLARFAGSVWEIEPVGSYRDMAFAFDPLTGEPTMSLRSPDSDTLMFARFDGLGWNIETVTDLSSFGDASLAYDADGHPAILYRVNATTGRGHDRIDVLELRLARFDGTAWNVEVVDADISPAHSSLAFDSAGYPTAAYSTSHSSGTLMFARFDGASWQSEVVDAVSAGKVVSLVRLVYDPGGDPAITYTVQGSGVKYVSLARFNGTAWDIDTVDGCVACCAGSLAFDASGNPFVSYQSWESRRMNVASWDGVAWNIDFVETGNPILGPGMGSSLAFDPAGNPTVSYFDDQNDLFKFAQKVGP